jgi:putative ABC transport system permease protein
MTFLTHDLRHAFRTLARNPGLTAAATVTLALGIGATTLIFSAVHGLLLAPLPFPDSDRLVSLWEKNPERGWYKNWVARANYLDWREQCRSFSGIAAYWEEPETAVRTSSGEPEAVRGTRASANFFSVLGVPPALGRLPRDEEDWIGASRVVVISDAYWRTRFGADPRVLGRTLTLNGDDWEIIGVAPPGFAFPSRDVLYWRTLRMDPEDRPRASFRRAHMLRVVARLAPGVTPEAAGADLEAVAARLELRYPDTNRKMGAGLTPLHEWQVGSARTPLLVLLAAVGLLLTIACANVGNLLLARAAGRRKEIAVRAALGAGRARIARQLFAESAALALVGGGLGVLAAVWGLPLLKTLAPPGRADFQAIHLSGSVLAFAVLASGGSALLFGLAPTLRVLRSNFGEDLKGSGVGAAGTRRSGALSGSLVVTEIALALLLFFGAFVSGRSFWRLAQVDAGFQTQGRLTARVLLRSNAYEKDEAVVAFQNAVLPRLRALPGVREAAAAAALPLAEQQWSSDFSVRGRGPDDFGVEVTHNEVSPGYFRTMGTPVLRGRDFREQDREGAVPVVLINETLARRYFAAEDPIGQQVAFDRAPDAESNWLTIVGVVADQRHETLASQPRAVFFAPLAQDVRRGVSFVVDADGDPQTLISGIRAAVRAADPQLPIYDVRTLDEIREAALGRDRFLLLLLGLFGGSAVLLAVIGVYGVTSHDARLRRREIGIRMAVGASAGDVERLVVARGLRLGLAGTALGAAAALACAGLLKPLLYGIAPADPLTLTSVAVLLVAATTTACYIPARRAGRLDPVSVLRSE